MVYSFEEWFNAFTRAHAHGRIMRVQALAQGFDMLFDQYVLDARPFFDAIGEYWCEFGKWVPTGLFARHAGSYIGVFASHLGEHMFDFGKGVSMNKLGGAGEFARGLGMNVRYFASSGDMRAFFRGLATSREARHFFESVDTRAFAAGLVRAGKTGALECVSASMLAHASDPGPLLVHASAKRVIAVMERMDACKNVKVDASSVSMLSGRIMSQVNVPVTPSVFAALCNAAPAHAMVGAGLAGFAALKRWNRSEWDEFFVLVQPNVHAVFEAARPFAFSFGSAMGESVSALISCSGMHTNTLYGLGQTLDGFLDGIGESGVARLLPHVDGVVRRKCIEFALKK